MFPAGPPGAALLLLRLALGFCLFLAPQYPLALALTPLAAGRILAALLLLFGALTPLGAGLGLLLALAAPPAGSYLFAAPVAALALALALIGPGAYAIDARLFGRRRMVFEHRSGQDRIV